MTILKRPDAKLVIRKIALSAIFIALCVVSTIISKTFEFGFIRISIAPGLIIVSSIVLGPIWGAFVGFTSDLLAYFTFNPSGFPYSPTIGVMYAILGFVSYFVYSIFKNVKNENSISTVLIGVLAGLFISLQYQLLTTDTLFMGVVGKDIPQWLPYLLSGIVTLLLIVYIVFILVFTNLRAKANKDTLEVLRASLTCLIMEIVVLFLLGSLIKSVYFNMNIEVIAMVQLLILFIAVPINTFLLVTFKSISKRLKF